MDFGEVVDTMVEVRRAGERLRGAIGASRDAWVEVVGRIGETQAAVLVLYVLQIHADDVTSGRGMIKSPGGLFRALGRRVASGHTDLVREIHGLRRKKAGEALNARLNP